jgi:hypothetical protein
MAAILDSLGFTFLIDRMTEVLTPDIYIELTGVVRWVAFSVVALVGGHLTDLKNMAVCQE